VTAPDGVKKKTSSGSFGVLAANRFRFAYARPFEQVIVADGDKVWIYDADLNQVSSRKISSALGATPAALLAGGTLERDFELTPLPDKDGLEWAKATPKAKESAFPGDRDRLSWQDARSRRDRRQLRPALGAQLCAVRRQCAGGGGELPLHATAGRRRDRVAGAAAILEAATLRYRQVLDRSAGRGFPARLRHPRCDNPRMASPTAAELPFADPPEAPLAERLRPRTLGEVVGQQHLLGPGKPLQVAFESRRLHSMILWGPPGTGKTTLARLMTDGFDAQFIAVSAVLGGVKEIRDAVERAGTARHAGRRTVLFVDEVHRFNKAQQDAFLPHVESGLLTFIGATTENPSFEVNSALLSRATVHVLKPLDDADLVGLLLGGARRACSTPAD
jgi:hypothetical protein